MKTLIFLTLCTFSFVAMADCGDSVSTGKSEEKMEIKTDTPKFLEGAKICVRLASGKETCASAEKFKVVPRKQQFIVTHTQNDTLRVCTQKVNTEKNRVAIVGGEGPKEGLDISRDGNTQSVGSKYGTVLGLQYQRKTDWKVLHLPLSFGVQVQDNHTGLGTVGVDF